MKGINIDGENKLIINPIQLDINKYKTPQAIDQAPDLESFSYEEPVSFGTGCFGNPNAFNRLQEILHQTATLNEKDEQVATFETDFAPVQDNGVVEPVFC